MGRGPRAVLADVVAVLSDQSNGCTPALTPTQYEQRCSRLEAVESQAGEHYAAIRNLRSVVDCNALATFHQLAQLARMMGGTLVPPPDDRLAAALRVLEGGT